MKPNEPAIEEYYYKGGTHRRIGGIWNRIEDGVIVDTSQYRNDLESRADYRARGGKYEAE